MITVMICFARSGGTLLNRCLGSLPNTVMFSEVNPFACADGTEGPETYKTLHKQALEWYGINLRSENFVGCILELEEHCRQNNKKLIIRDWPLINFSGHHEGSNPPNKLLTLRALEGKCEIKAFAFVRDAIDVWISHKMKNVYSFFPEYLRYIEAVKAENIPIFKYEDFCRDPHTSMKSICDYAGLEYQDVTSDYYKYTKITGDTVRSRGLKQQKITLFPRKVIPAKKSYDLSTSEEMKKANEMMGYNPYSFEGSPLQWHIERICSPIRRQAKNIRTYTRAPFKKKRKRH